MKFFLGMAVLISTLAMINALPQPSSDEDVLKVLQLLSKDAGAGVEQDYDVPSREALVQALAQIIVEANQYEDDADVNQYEDDAVVNQYEENANANQYDDNADVNQYDGAEVMQDDDDSNANSQIFSFFLPYLFRGK